MARYLSAKMWSVACNGFKSSDASEGISTRESVSTLRTLDRWYDRVWRTIS